MSPLGPEAPVATLPLLQPPTATLLHHVTGRGRRFLKAEPRFEQKGLKAMSGDLPSKAGIATIVRVEFTPPKLKRLDAWIGSLPEPRPDREQAVRMIVRDRLDQTPIGSRDD